MRYLQGDCAWRAFFDCGELGTLPARPALRSASLSVSCLDSLWIELLQVGGREELLDRNRSGEDAEEAIGLGLVVGQRGEQLLHLGRRSVEAGHRAGELVHRECGRI